MANSKSALKNIRKNKARYLRNRAVASKLKTLEKHFVGAVEGKNKDEATKAGTAFISALEKANKANIVHKNKIARKKSRCAALLESL
jgi:small subunit ribosomal protein S20